MATISANRRPIRDRVERNKAWIDRMSIIPAPVERIGAQKQGSQ
jgi:hypothetical protein